MPPLVLPAAQRRARWLSFFSSSDLAEMASASPDIPDEVRSFYEIVGRLKEQSQLYVTLRYVEGMRLEELATAMEVSLATAKRHLQKAEMEFTTLLGTDEAPHVAPWLRGVAR